MTRREKKPDTEEILKLIYEMMLSPKFPEIPAELEGMGRFAEIAAYIRAFRDCARRFARGDLSCELKGHGFLMECFREFQTNLRLFDDEIRKQATLDQLTKLPNRYLYKDRLSQNMVMAKRNAASLVLILWDLDGFKPVNDTYGHLAGDRLLVAVAELMRSSLRETDTLARFGGDEFVMLIPGYPGHEEEVANLTTSRVFGALREPVGIGVGEEKVTIGASCGISFFPRHTNDGEILFNLADKALYEAKKSGKNTAVVWNGGKLGRQKAGSPKKQGG
ncbi:MAG: GGDEF domain-containing protein [Synergistaceae bacterium]|jgi:diguanylate cyclase (GGDEF)-like protein|nr:GGDEF domain-containing protein [Synergistaceae bacterium]